MPNARARRVPHKTSPSPPKPGPPRRAQPSRTYNVHTGRRERAGANEQSPAPLRARASAAPAAAHAAAPRGHARVASDPAGPLNKSTHVVLSRHNHTHPSQPTRKHPALPRHPCTCFCVSMRESAVGIRLCGSRASAPFGISWASFSLRFLHATFTTHDVQVIGATDAGTWDVRTFLAFPPLRIECPRRESRCLRPASPLPRGDDTVTAPTSAAACAFVGRNRCSFTTRASYTLRRALWPRSSRTGERASASAEPRAHSLPHGALRLCGAPRRPMPRLLSMSRASNGGYTASIGHEMRRISSVSHAAVFAGSMWCTRRRARMWYVRHGMLSSTACCTATAATRAQSCLTRAWARCGASFRTGCDLQNEELDSFMKEFRLN
jgi:hypothetical protein